SVQYGKGPASNFSTSVTDPSPYVKDSERFRVAEHVLIQPNPVFAIMAVAVYQQSRTGAPGAGWDRWISLGARPQVFFNDVFSVAFEAGVWHPPRPAGPQRGRRP